MNVMLAFLGLGPSEALLIFAAFLLLFGAKKLPELAKGLGTGIKEFKKATREVTDEIQNPTVETAQSKLSAGSPTPSQPQATVAQTPTPPKA